MSAPPTRAARLARLLALLPRIYNAQPQTSVIGALLQVMAQELAQLDDDLLQVLHDRWLGLASAQRPDPDSAAALERLGHLLEVRRLQRRQHSPAPASTGSTSSRRDDAAPATPLIESAAAYRQRIGISARILSNGLTTPRALLELALADLGTDPCPAQQTRLDATIAFGMKTGTRRRCALCQGEARLSASQAQMVCPNKTERLCQAALIENPLQQKRHVQSLQHFQQRFTVTNLSLEPDRPRLRLLAIDQSIESPALQNCLTGEIVLFAGSLQPGDTLTIEPALLDHEVAPFNSYERIGHHGWRDSYPAGRAWISSSNPDVVDDGSTSRDVSSQVFYLLSSRLNQATSRFGGVNSAGLKIEGTRFGVLQQQPRTPQMPRGSSDWMMFSLKLPSQRVDLADPAARSMLLQSLSNAMQNQADRAVKLSLTLEWIARPPATFRLSVPKNDWVSQAEALGALELLRRDIDAARAAGVRALLEFTEPVQIEPHQIDEQWQGIALRQSWPEPVWAEGANPGEMPLQVKLRQTLREPHRIKDGQFAFKGIFNTTRFGWSKLG